MSTDNADKTVFRQARSDRNSRIDATVIRPTPGRRNTNPQAPAQQESPRHEYTTASGQHNQASAAPYQDFVAGKFTTQRGLNPLVNAASTLLAVFYKTRQSVSHPNVGGLHQQLVTTIRNFEINAKSQNIKPEIILSARYVLCAALDEAVLNTPWGSESAWTQRTLLSLFHNETNGGEKFYLILERMKNYPAENLDFLELIYLLLSLGFEGKYRVITRGRDAIEHIRDELYSVIRTYRGDYERALSTNWRGLGKSKKSLASYVPMWVMASVVAGVLVLSYSGFRYWLHHSTAQVTSQLNAIAGVATNQKPVQHVIR
jgi:type VI secretion system protein ImpK